MRVVSGSTFGGSRLWLSSWVRLVRADRAAAGCHSSSGPPPSDRVRFSPRRTLCEQILLIVTLAPKASHERSSPRTDVTHESPRPGQRHPIRSTLVQEGSGSSGHVPARDRRRHNPGSAVVANTGLLEKTSIAKEPAAGRRRVVIIGAGLAGIAAAYSW